MASVTDAQGQKNIPVIPRSEATWESVPFAEASLPIGWAGTGDADRRTSGGGHRLRNDRGRRTAVVGSQEWVQGTASACGSINKIVPGVLPRTMPKHRDTTLLRRLLTQVGLMKCRYTSALLRAPPSEPKAQMPSTRRLRSHVPPSVPRPLSPGRALFGGLKWGTLSFIATLKSYRKISLRFSDKRV